MEGLHCYTGLPVCDVMSKTRWKLRPSRGGVGSAPYLWVGQWDLVAPPHMPSPASYPCCQPPMVLSCHSRVGAYRAKVWPPLSWQPKGQWGRKHSLHHPADWLAWIQGTLPTSRGLDMDSQRAGCGLGGVKFLVKRKFYWSIASLEAHTATTRDRYLKRYSISFIFYKDPYLLKGMCKRWPINHHI